MSLTLVEAQKYSNDVLQTGVIELFVRNDPILNRMKFKTVLGNGLTYDREATEAGAGWYNVGDTWVESTPTVSQTTATLKILGGDVDIDNFLLTTTSNLQDLQGEMINKKTKAMHKEFMQTFYYGYNAGNTKEFDGAHTLIQRYTSGSNNTLAIATVSGTPVALQLTAHLEQAKDMIRSGDAALIMMSHNMRRRINKYLKGVGGITYRDAADARVQTLFGTDVGVSHYIGDDESCDYDYNSSNYGHNPADGLNGVDDAGATSIFIFNFDEDGMKGIQAKPLQIQTVSKELETKDASRFRIKWYVSLMMQNLLSCSKVTGIDQDGTVAV